MPPPSIAQVLSFDQDGLFEGREVAVQKPPIRILERVEQLQLLTTLSETGLLSAAEVRARPRPALGGNRGSPFGSRCRRG